MGGDLPYLTLLSCARTTGWSQKGAGWRSSPPHTVAMPGVSPQTRHLEGCSWMKHLFTRSPFILRQIEVET